MTDEWFEGYYDFKSKEHDNPYPILSDAWYDWNAGWESAVEESK